MFSKRYKAVTTIIENVCKEFRTLREIYGWHNQETELEIRYLIKKIELSSGSVCDVELPTRQCTQENVIAVNEIDAKVSITHRSQELGLLWNCMEFFV